MKNLLKFLAIVLTLNTFSASGQEFCEEIELGKMGKNHWKDSLTNGLRGELVTQMDKNDDLFEKLIPEAEFELFPYIDFNLRFTRSVKDHQPLPSNLKITPEDLFSLKVNDKLNLELVGRKEGPYLFTEGNAGVSLVHSSESYPGYELSPCEKYKKLLDLSNEKARAIFENTCSSRNKSRLARAYEDAIDFFSQSIASGLKYFISKEKNIEYAKDPLSPLKLHSLLGVPLDHTVFFENSNDVAVGDIVEHTSFFGIKPLGFNIDIFETLSPNYAHYKRYFRTLSFKKMMKNKVMVEIEDTVISGNELEVFRIRPRLLKIIKLYFGEWSIDDFRQQTFRQKFEIDLNEEDGKGQQFFKKILLSAYIPEGNLNEDTILIDHSDYAEDVKAFSPVFRDSEVDDNKFIVKLPGILDFEKRDYQASETISYDIYKYINGTRLKRSKFRNKLTLWGLFDEAERKFECKVNLFSNSVLVLDDNASMNLECSYFNKFSSDEHAKDVLEFMDMLTLGKTKVSDRKILSELQYSDPSSINMYTNQSYSKKQLDNILKASEEEIYSNLAILIFGSDAESVFAPKFHSTWKKAKPLMGPKKSAYQKAIRNSKVYKECSSLLAHLKIVDSYNEMYTQLDGVAGRDKGIDAYNSNRCYNYFSTAKEVANNVLRFQEMVGKTGRLQTVLNVFEDLDKMGLYQSLLATLAGGVGEDNVRYTYIVTSPLVKKVIADSNGRKYDAQNKNLKKSISSELDADFASRIDSLRLTYNSCNPSVLIAYSKFKYPIGDEKNIKAMFTMTENGDPKEQNITQQVLTFEQMQQLQNGEYVAFIRLDEKLNKKEAHDMYFELINQNDMRVSRELKIYLKQLDLLLDFVPDRD